MYIWPKEISNYISSIGYTMLLSGVLRYYQLEDLLGNDIIRLDNQANQGRFNISIYGKICKIWLKLQVTHHTSNGY